MTTLKTTRTTTTTSATASERPPQGRPLIADGCGGTPLSTFAVFALAQYGPVWLWRQASKRIARN